MKRSVLLFLALTACGDNVGGPIAYKNPPKGGKLRLVTSKAKPASQDEVVLDLVVGDEAVTGYSVGFNLPIGHELVQLAEFTPGKALDPGTSPPAAGGVIGSGPLTDTLVTGLSQKAIDVQTDTTLAPKSVLYTIRLRKVGGAPKEVVFDGTADGFHLPSGGMRDRGGTTVVDAADVAIGKLEIK